MVQKTYSSKNLLGFWRDWKQRKGGRRGRSMCIEPKEHLDHLIKGYFFHLKNYNVSGCEEWLGECIYDFSLIFSWNESIKRVSTKKL